MADKPKTQALRTALEGTLCVLLFLLPFTLWLVLQKREIAYQPSAADVISLTSAFIVLLVFIVQLHFRSASIISRSREFKKQIDQLEAHTRELEAHTRELSDQLKNIEKASFSPPTDKPDELPPVLGPVTTDAEQDPPPISGPSPPPPDPPEETILEVITSCFIEHASLRESNADRLVLELGKVNSVGENPPKIAVIYRDGAAENSSSYSMSRIGIQTPFPSIILIFPSGVAKLLPAPMAGQDSFRDVKAFNSDTPKPSQNPSRLIQCQPATLFRSDENTFVLDQNQKGKLNFR